MFTTLRLYCCSALVRAQFVAQQVNLRPPWPWLTLI